MLTASPATSASCFLDKAPGFKNILWEKQERGTERGRDSTFLPLYTNYNHHRNDPYEREREREYSRLRSIKSCSIGGVLSRLIREKRYHYKSTSLFFLSPSPSLSLSLSLLLRNKIEVVGNENHMHTRQAGKIVLGFRKTRNAQKSVFYEETKFYNLLSLGIGECDRLNIFKRELNIFGGQYNILSYIN